MKKNDWILITVIGLIAGVVFFVYMFLGHHNAGMVTVTIKDELYGTYDLSKEQEIMINDTNCMVIKDGKVDMITGDCRDQICVNHKPISKNGETIVCLPNHIIVKILGGNEAELDAVTD